MKIQKNKTWMDLQPDDSVWFLNVCWMHRVKIHLLGLDYIIKHIPAAKAFGLIQSVITKGFALYLWIWGRA